MGEGNRRQLPGHSSAVTLQDELRHSQQRGRLKTVIAIELCLGVLDEFLSNLRIVHHTCTQCGTQD